MNFAERDDSVHVPAASAPLFLNANTGAGDDSVEAHGLAGGTASLGDGNDSLALRGFLGSAEQGLQYVEGGAVVPACPRDAAFPSCRALNRLCQAYSTDPRRTIVAPSCTATS